MIYSATTAQGPMQQSLIGILSKAVGIKLNKLDW